MTAANVLFITVDQWRGDCLSAAGHPVVKTPNLDRLAARGVRFANHWSVTAPCGPSRASLLTGLYLMNHRSVNNGAPLDHRFTNIAREARAAGYDPTLFGYTDTSVDPRTVADPNDPRLRDYEGVMPGFTSALVLTEANMSAWARWLTARGIDVPADTDDLYLPVDDYPGAADHAPAWAPSRVTAEHTETAFVTEEVIRWLDERDDKPWFAHVSFVRPHPPYRAPEGYHDRYDPDSGPPFKRVADRSTEIGRHPLHRGGTHLAGCPVDEREARQLRASYWGNMAEVDHQLGRLFDHLDEAGLTDETLVVLTSDHGEQMGDHWLVQKLGWWDESYHIPLIVADPRPAAVSAKGTVVDAFTESVDVMPTLCDWLGIETPVAVDGRSLERFVLGSDIPANWRTECHWQWDWSDPVDHVAEDIYGLTMEQCKLDVIRSAHHKYVHFGDGSSLLFDLDADPDQVADSAETVLQPGAAEQISQARGQLLEWRMRHEDRTLSGHRITKN
ncbi:MAG: alkaline phosphatase family protein, partial [Aquihabitans sp.]